MVTNKLRVFTLGTNTTNVKKKKISKLEYIAATLTLIDQGCRGRVEQSPVN